MAVGELLLSAFFQVIFDRLAPHGELLNFVRQLGGGVDSELKKWENTLTMIKAVLSDAEEKQLTDQAVKIWLDSLRDLAYDVEDILDVFATRALEHKLIAEHDHEASTSKVQRLLPVAFFRCFNRYTVKFNHSMRSSVKDITGRLEELCKQRIELGLQLTPGGHHQIQLHSEGHPVQVFQQNVLSSGDTKIRPKYLKWYRPIPRVVMPILL